MLCPVEMIFAPNTTLLRGTEKRAQSPAATKLNFSEVNTP
jgi:hypothetical protein